jgi:hypothetical protein
VQALIPNKENRSAPTYILAQLKEDDELWLMVDVDRWGSKNLASVAAQAGHNKFNLAVSRVVPTLKNEMNHSTRTTKTVTFPE